MFVTTVQKCWCSAWLQGSERARVHRHCSSQENLCCREKEFKWATLTWYTVVFCTCIMQYIFNYLCFSVLFILFPSLAWIIWFLQYCKTECHWRTFFSDQVTKVTFLCRWQHLSGSTLTNRMIVTEIKMASNGYPLEQVKVSECKEINLAMWINATPQLQG
jgi:hypothetical protein